MIKDDYNKYQKEYRDNNVVLLSVQLNKAKDSDIIEAIGEQKISPTAKKLMRLGIDQIKKKEGKKMENEYKLPELENMNNLFDELCEEWEILKEKLDKEQ